jgi:ketosteroid isomerase-like protein
MTTRATRQLETAEEAVRRANAEFYLAFASLDLARMDAVWLHEDWVACVHPGWDLLLGWEDVRASWAQILTSTERVRIDVSSVLVRIEGDVAWVSCREHIMTTFAKDFSQAHLQATNIFLRRESPSEADGRWFLVAHHASALPPGRPASLQ